MKKLSVAGVLYDQQKNDMIITLPNSQLSVSPTMSPSLVRGLHKGLRGNCTCTEAVSKS